MTCYQLQIHYHSSVDAPFREPTDTGEVYHASLSYSSSTFFSAETFIWNYIWSLHSLKKAKKDSFSKTKFNTEEHIL